MGPRGRRPLRRCALAAALLAAVACLALLPPPPPPPPPPSAPAAVPALRTVVAYSLQRKLHMEPRTPIPCRPLLAAPAPEPAPAAPGGWVSAPDARLHLFSAHYDRRLPGFHYVRVIAMVQGPERPRLFCHLWYEGAPAAVVMDALDLHIWWDEWDDSGDGLPTEEAFRPVLLSCPVPAGGPAAAGAAGAGRGATPGGDAAAPDAAASTPPPGDEDLPPPAAVALSTRPCQRSPAIVALPKPTPSGPGRPAPHGEFAVCVKGLDLEGTDDAAAALRLAEWLELQLLLGAQHVFLYVLRAGERVLRVLRHYAQRGAATAVPLALPPGQPNEPAARHRFLRAHTWQRRKHELVPYNDCFYRNIHRFRFVVPLDIDEVIVPVRGRSWSDVVRLLEAQAPDALHRSASLAVRHAYFLASFGEGAAAAAWPPFLHALRHTARAANFSSGAENAKSFVRTDATLAVFNHYALHTLVPGSPRYTLLPTTLAQMNHYRQRCPDGKDCSEDTLQEDDILPRRFGARLRARLEPVVAALGLLEPAANNGVL